MKDKACGTCSHLWDEDACLGTWDGSACEKWDELRRTAKNE